MEFTIEDADLHTIKKNLFNYAMQGKWNEVVNIWRQHPRAHKAEIVVSGDTALHVAVSEGKESIVEELVELIRETELDALEMRNEQGNTPLHLAASMGNVPICKCLAGKHPKLVGVRNHENETPLFSAVLHGRKDAFLCLHKICDRTKQYEYSRRADGKTILHCAIFGEFLDLAFQIIYLNEDFVSSVDEEGFTPLHLLAGLIVEKLEKNESYNHFNRASDDKKPRYPDNYGTCMSFWKIIKVPVSMGRGKSDDSMDAENPKEKGHQSRNGAQQHQLLPPNYDIIFEFIKLAYKAMLVFLGLGTRNIEKIKEKKEKHTWSCQIMDELLQRASIYEYDRTGKKPLASQYYRDEEARPENVFLSDAKQNDNTGGMKQNENKKDEKKKTRKLAKMDTPILIAAKNGVKEMVEKILELFPVAIHDRDSERKNAVLLAVENRQPEVFEVLVKRNFMRDTVFSAVDNEGNSALHLAAMLRDTLPWHIPGHALQMQWEIKWYKYVKKSMPHHFFSHFNNHNMTPKEIFTENHALIATVAFSSTASIPGSFNDKKRPNRFLNTLPEFTIFAIASLIALCFSVTSLIMFLAILTSRHQEKDFHKQLPKKLAWGLTALFISIGSMLISFCAAHYLVLKDKLQHVAGPVYAVACLPIAFFAVAQFPLYLDLLRATSRKVPQRSYKVDL
ncbi:hypothetical protein CK203_002561 [Vitis vinifera]|uniref:PGG domain-containing protein n=1 Tax=Vitis vinifera TaxID=29760 RepID=A0A438KHW6_VITVI|nr:hypothetical protein CK203_002561 [Vitis vinifera]